MLNKNNDSLRNPQNPGNAVTKMSFAHSAHGLIEAGSALLGYGEGALKAHQLEVAAMLDDRPTSSAVTMPRRSGKTESVLMWLLGLCAERPGTAVAFTMATTRDAASQKMVRDLVPAVNSAALDGLADAHGFRGSGGERIEFGNGSLIRVVAPEDRAFRSQRYDVVYVDEAGEASADDSAGMLAGALPTLDTSELSMLIVSGTVGDFRTGNLLWDALESPAGRSVRYDMTGGVDLERVESDWGYVSDLLTRVHPGVGTLTTLDRLRRNWEQLRSRPESFAKEYLGLWGSQGVAGSLFSADSLAESIQGGGFPEPPRRFGLGLHADVSGRWAVVAAWRVEGVPQLLLLDCGGEPTAAAASVERLARRYRVDVAMDPKRTQVAADVWERVQRRRVPSQALTYDEAGAAFDRLVRTFADGSAATWHQEELHSSLLHTRRHQRGKLWEFRADHPHSAAAAIAAAFALFDADRDDVPRSGLLPPSGV